MISSGPFQEVEVECPAEIVGTVIGKLSELRSMIRESRVEGNRFFIVADVPEDAVGQFTTWLRQLDLPRTQLQVNTFNELAPDPPMSPEQATIAASLSAELVERIDAAILSHARPAWSRKVAMIVGLTMSDPSLRVPGLPDLFYALRVKALVAKGALVAEGNLDYMRYSEVRLPSENRE